MPGGQLDAPTSPKDTGKNFQVTSVSTNKCYESREPLTELHVNSKTNVCEDIHQDINNKRQGNSGEHGRVCCQGQQENDTRDRESAEEIAQKCHKTASDKHEELSITSSDCANSVLSLESGSLPVITDRIQIPSCLNCHVSEQKDKESCLGYHASGQKDKESGLDCHVSEQKDKESGLGCHVSEQKDKEFGLDCHVSEQKDKESGLSCHVGKQKDKESGLCCHVDEQKDSKSDLDRHVSEQKDKETQVKDCLCDSSNRKSQASFLIRVNEPAKSSTHGKCAPLHLDVNSTNEFDSNYNEATTRESTSTARSGTTTSCERSTRPNTTVNECNKCDTICSGIASDNITQLPSHPKPNSVQQDRSVHADSHQTTRTTIELNAHSVNSGRKYSDFSISFLLSQDSPSMRGTIRCQQTIPGRVCENTRHNCCFEAFRGNDPTSCNSSNTSTTCSSANNSTRCSCRTTPTTCSSVNTPTTCSCDVCSCNQEATKCRRDENCPSRQTLASAAGCCEKNQIGCCSSAGQLRNKESSHRCQSKTSSLPTTSAHCSDCDQRFNSSLTESTENDFGSIFKGEASGDEMLADGDTRCYTPVRRQLKRMWTADDSNSTQSEHESSLDSSMMTGASKMARFKYTEEQILYLKAEFTNNRYPSYDDLVKMSDDTAVPVRQLQVWFQNKRASTTGTRRPKIRRIDEYLEYENLSQPSTAGAAVAHPTQPSLVLPSSCTDSKAQSLPASPVIHDYGYQPYIPRMLADVLGRHQDLAANTFTNGQSAISHTHQRHLLPVQYAPHMYPGAALDAGSLQAYLTPLYGHSPGVGMGYQDINSLQIFNSYMAHSGALAMAAAPPPGNNQLFTLLGHPGVQPTPSVNNLRDLSPADVFMSSVLTRDKGKLP